MKATILLPALAAALAVSSASAQVLYDPQSPQRQHPLDGARGSEGKLATRDQEDTFYAKDGILRAQGAVQFMKNGKLTKVNQELKLSEGFVVRPNGQITKPDGSTINLKEGQMLTLDGRLVQAPASTGTTARGSGDKLPARSGRTSELTDFGQDGINGPGGKPRQ
ncbi:DUF6799 domain-containing protein [Verrucomicrobiota bacterium sgz303538]